MTSQVRGVSSGRAEGPSVDPSVAAQGLASSSVFTAHRAREAERGLRTGEQPHFPFLCSDVTLLRVLWFLQSAEGSSVSSANSLPAKFHLA